MVLGQRDLGGNGIGVKRLGCGKLKIEAKRLEGKRLEGKRLGGETTCYPLSDSLSIIRSVRVAERLALPTSDHGGRRFESHWRQDSSRT